MTKILGLTGGIASGKSTVSAYLGSLNLPIIDADLIAREVMKAGSPAISEICEQFGADMLLANGELDRKKLGDVIFASPEKRNQLNDIVQGRIRAEIKRQLSECQKKNPPLIILDIPLLYEEEYENQVDEIMVVYVDVDIQKARLRNRNKELTEEEALNRILSQMPLIEKAELADILIDNNGTVENTLSQVRKWLKTVVPEIEFAE